MPFRLWSTWLQARRDARLRRAVLMDSPSGVRAALANGACPNASWPASRRAWPSDVPLAVRQGPSSILDAAAVRDLALVEVLLDAGARVNGTGGLTPLWRATAAGRPAIALALLGAGASIDCSDAEGNGLWAAAVRGAWPLSERSVNATSLISTVDDTGLADAQAWHLMFALLCQAKVDPDRANRDGIRPLHWALRTYNPVAARALLSAGAQWPAHDDKGRSMLAQLHVPCDDGLWVPVLELKVRQVSQALMAGLGNTIGAPVQPWSVRPFWTSLATQAELSASLPAAVPPRARRL